MINKLQPGDYGRFHFTQTFKGEITGFNLCAEVIELDGKRILLRDNDGIEYLPKKSDIDFFKLGVKQTDPCGL
jgi:hypothetical protein